MPPSEVDCVLAAFLILRDGLKDAAEQGPASRKEKAGTGEIPA
jgi:hypothetical protein